VRSNLIGFGTTIAVWLMSIINFVNAQARATFAQGKRVSELEGKIEVLVAKIESLEQRHGASGVKVPLVPQFSTDFPIGPDPSTLTGVEKNNAMLKF